MATNIDLSKVPAATAPKGKTSNLVNPESEGYLITIINVVCLVVVLVVFILRMITRIHIVKSVGYDDCK